MSTTSMRLISTGLFFLFIFLSGFWLSHSGKPYSTLIFNIHKLIGLAAAVFLIVTVVAIHRQAPLQSGQIAAVATTAVLFVLLVVVGGLLSVQSGGGLASAPPFLKTGFVLVHHLLPYLAVLSTGVTLYLLLFRR